jgi:DNA-directed RNA polymerase II subunit RPB2
MIYNQEDMPFTKDGISPDLIINPHAMPSRLTIGQLVECIMGKACACLGRYGEAASFNNVQVEDTCDILEDYGFKRNAIEIMYHGRNGEQLKYSTVYLWDLHFIKDLNIW